MRILSLIFSAATVISLGLTAAHITTAAATAQSYSNQSVNGENVKAAYFNGGRFEQTSPKVWKEYANSGGPRFTFRETHRDAWSVYLRDDSRNGDLQIDVHRKMISAGWNGGARSDLYPVTRFKAGSSAPQIRPLNRGNSSSSGGKVTLYQHCDYTGYRVSLPVGSFSLSSLEAKGMQNDDVSSIKVTPGYKVVIYQDAGYRGARRTLEGNTSCLTTYGMNDEISSVKVMSRSSSGTSNPRPTSTPRPTPPPRPAANTEQTCYNLIQGKVAWNRSGSKSWSSGNVKDLCSGTRNPAATRDCFTRGINMGKGWAAATASCKSNTNSFRGSYSPPSNSGSNAPINKSGNLACVCTGSGCGNGAIGGNYGDVFTKVSSSYAKAKFTPHSSTGWTCAVPSKTSGSGGPLACYCKGYCGNGGIGADPKTLRLGISQSSLTDYYGGGKKGNRTGWVCGNYRGDN